jgi:hypothetical protein
LRREDNGMSDTHKQSIEELSGSYRDIGRQHGENNAAHIRYLLKSYGVSEAAPWEPAHFLDALSVHLPDLVDEIHGIAEGSGCSLKEICGLSFLIDLGTAPTACTGVVFASGPDGPVMGKTCDCNPGLQQVWLRPRLVKPAGQPAALMLSHVGSPNAEMGMNENGLAIGITGLPSVALDHRGVGWQQDIRAVLHRCATTQETIELMQMIPIRGFGYCAVAVDAAGDVAIIDKVAGAMGVKRPDGNVAYVTNIAQCPEVIPHTTGLSENGLGRMALLKQLCDDESQMDFSFDGLLRMFHTHGEPVGLCQHGPELHSTTGFFMLPSKGMIHIARGHTCNSELEAFRF